MDIPQKIPDDLVNLNTIDQSLWIGLRIYHPMLQVGATPYWKTEDYPTWCADEEDDPGYAYDVGIIDSIFEIDQWGDARVCFKTKYGKLYYGSYNLWVSESDLKEVIK
jgi:hypothetical protein